MANEHGLLPKAEPSELDEELQRKLGTWFDTAYADDNLFLTLAKQPAVMDLFLSWVSFVYSDASKVDSKIIELCRIRMAARNQCVH